MEIEIASSDSEIKAIYRGDIIKDNLADRCLTVDDFVCTNGEKCLKGDQSFWRFDWASCYGGVPKIPDGFRLHVYDTYNCETESKIDKDKTRPRCAYYFESLYDYKKGVRETASWSLVNAEATSPEMTLWLYAANNNSTPPFNNINMVQGGPLSTKGPLDCGKVDAIQYPAIVYQPTTPAKCSPFYENVVDYQKLCENKEAVTVAGNPRSMACRKEPTFRTNFGCHVDTRVECGEFAGDIVLKNHGLEPSERISIEILEHTNLTQFGDQEKHRYPMNLKLKFKASRIPTYIEGKGPAYTHDPTIFNWLRNFNKTTIPTDAKLYWNASLCVQVVSHDFFNRVYNFEHVPSAEHILARKNLDKKFSLLFSPTNILHNQYFKGLKTDFRNAFDAKNSADEQQRQNIECCLESLSQGYTFPKFTEIDKVSIVVPLSVYEDWLQNNHNNRMILQTYLQRFFADANVKIDDKLPTQITVDTNVNITYLVYTPSPQPLCTPDEVDKDRLSKGNIVLGVRLNGRIADHSIMSMLYMSIRFDSLLTSLAPKKCLEIYNNCQGVLLQTCLRAAEQNNINMLITSCTTKLGNVAMQADTKDIKKAFVTVDDKHCQCINKFSESADMTDKERASMNLCFGNFCTNHADLQKEMGNAIYDKNWTVESCSDMCEPFVKAYANSDISSEVNIDQFRKVCPRSHLPIDQGALVNSHILLVGGIVELVYLSVVGLSRRLGDRRSLWRDLLIGGIIAIVYGVLSFVLRGESKICQYNAVNKSICQRPADSTKQYEAVCVNRLAGHEYRIPHEFCSRRIHDECITQNDCLAPELGCGTCDMDTHQCMADAGKKRVTEVVEYREIPYYTLLMVIPSATLLIRAALSHVRDRKVRASLIGSVVFACVAAVIVEYREPDSYHQTKKCVQE